MNDDFRPEESFAPRMLAGQVAVVTGGGTGIGRHLALGLGRLGARVVLASRKRDNLEAVARELAALGAESLVVEMNVRSEADVERMVSETLARFGTVDILLNNAGANFLCPAAGMTPNGWRTVVDVVLNGSFLCARAVGKAMIERRRGRIVSIAATNAHDGSPMMVHSGAAKAGLISMTETLAVEWAPFGVLVNCVSPGPVSTEGANQRLWADPDRMAKLEARVPLGRFARAEDCVGPVLFLLSPAARFVTGANLIVDGADRLRHIPELG